MEGVAALQAVSGIIIEMTPDLEPLIPVMGKLKKPQKEDVGLITY
jgi:hypothetical protein